MVLHSYFTLLSYILRVPLLIIYPMNGIFKISNLNIFDQSRKMLESPKKEGPKKGARKVRAPFFGTCQYVPISTKRTQEPLSGREQKSIEKQLCPVIDSRRVFIVSYSNRSKAGI